MKNKKMLYILVPLTALLWGMIIYKIMNAVNGTGEAVFQPLSVDVQQSEMISDTFTIEANYRDPFNSKEVRKVSIQTNSLLQNNNIQTKNKIEKPVVSVSMPNVVYMGMIKNQKQNKQIVMIQINGNINNMIVGDKIDGVELVKIYKDSVEMKYNKERFFVRR